MGNVINYDKYDDASIRVLKDIEHVRLRPSMYISTDRPSYQMFTEISDNAFDEAMNGYATQIKFNINYEENFISVEDNGRGLPQGMNKDLNKPTIFAIYQKLNAGGKYDQSSYAMSGGLNGVGSTVVNALSKELYVKTWRDTSVAIATFRYGETLTYNTTKEKSLKGTSGTRVAYTIDTDLPLFTDSLADYKKDIRDKISLMKTLMPKVEIIYNNEVIESRDFREFLPSASSPLFDEAILFEIKDYSVAINWSTENNKNLHRSYCNGIFTPNGGDHVNGIQNAIINVFGSDSMYGLNLALSINHPQVEYDSQAKTKAISKSMKSYLTESFTSELKYFMRKNQDIQSAITKLIARKRNELDKRKNKSNVRRDNKTTFLSALGVTGFADCSTKYREEAELYIVEGNSAAGSAKQARDIRTQAIMPLRGKVLNTENASIETILKNREISTIFSNLDTGIFDEFNIKKSRYGKVIIFTDADEDGKNIAALLITLFMTLSPSLVEQGYLYLALPPLYGTYEGKKFIPINDEETKNEYLKKGYYIQRYKGLGEMNAEQLKISCMDPSSRRIIRIDTSEDCASEISKIMGSDTQYRKELLARENILW